MPEFNPFEAPEEDSRVIENPPVEMTLVLMKFRQQMKSLGRGWILFGGVGIVISGMTLLGLQDGSMNQDTQLVMIMIAIGLISVVLFAAGIATCLMKLCAVYIGLGISYLGLLGSFSNFNIVPFLVLILVIIQAHRVIGYSKTLLTAGIPLDSKP